MQPGSVRRNCNSVLAGEDGQAPPQLRTEKARLTPAAPHPHPPTHPPTHCLQVVAEAYDVPIPGYATRTCSNLRLWDALPSQELDLGAFNKGEYDKVCRAGSTAVVLQWYCGDAI